MPRFQVGTLLFNKYKIEEFLGRGGFAEVYLGRHIHLNVRRALKLVSPRDPLDTAMLRRIETRFRLEAQLGARFGPTPYLVQVYDFEHEPAHSLLALIMEYMPGGSLKARLRLAHHGLPVDEVIAIAYNLAHALALLHAQQIVHRDIKPGNILFDAQGRARLADLGVVQMPSSQTRLAHLRHPGTPAYMSPEQEQGRDLLPPASDIYSLGVVLFEALTGRNPKHLPPDQRYPRRLRKDVPDWLDALIVQMLAPSPEDRPWNGEVLVRRLDEHLRDFPPPPPPPSPTTKEETPVVVVEGMDIPSPPIPAPQGEGKPAPREPSSSLSRPLWRQILPAPAQTLYIWEKACLVALTDFRLQWYQENNLRAQWKLALGPLTAIFLLSETPPLLMLGSHQGQWAIWEINLPYQKIWHQGLLDSGIIAFLSGPGPWKLLALTEQRTLWGWRAWHQDPHRLGQLTRARPVAVDWSSWGFLVAEEQGRLTVWQPRGQEWTPVKKWRFPTGWRAMAVLPSAVCLGDDAGTLWLVHPLKGQVLRQWQAHDDELRAIYWVSGRLITLAWDHRLHIWDETGFLLSERHFSEPITALTASPAGICVATATPQILLYPIPTIPRGKPDGIQK